MVAIAKKKPSKRKTMGEAKKVCLGCVDCGMPQEIKTSSIFKKGNVFHEIDGLMFHCNAYKIWKAFWKVRGDYDK